MALHIKRPAIVQAAGTKPKVIEEYVGMVNNGLTHLSVARMTSPKGWSEPAQTPEFEEITVVLRGVLVAATRAEVFRVRTGQALIVEKGEWVRYSAPFGQGADSISIYIPAFSPDPVHREAEENR